MADDGGESLYIHSILQGYGGKRVPRLVGSVKYWTS